MILRSTAVRYGRCPLRAAYLPRTALRQQSTAGRTQNDLNGSPSAAAQPNTAASSPAQDSQILSSKKRKQKLIMETLVSLAATNGPGPEGPSWTRPHKIGQEMVTPAQQYAMYLRIGRLTRSFGSDLVKRYNPSDLINKPPIPEDVTLELLMASQTHMGHHKSLWNPANSRYIFGVRQGIHVISLEITAAHLRRAARVVEDVSYRGGTILFVGTRRSQMEIVTEAASLAGGCHLFTKWTPGAITNRDIILSSRQVRVVNHLDRKLSGFDTYKESSRPLLPDLVVCLNPIENFTLLYECGLQNIPTIGVIDTNADPSWVTYTIPSNDDSLRAISLIAGVLGRAGERGKNRRLAAAREGHVPWTTAPRLIRYMKKEIQEVIRRNKEVMGKLQSNVVGFNEEEQSILGARYQGEQVQVDESKMMKMMSETITDEKKTSSTMTAAFALRTDGVEAKETDPVVLDATADGAVVEATDSTIEPTIKATSGVVADEAIISATEPAKNAKEGGAVVKATESATELTEDTTTGEAPAEARRKVAFEAKIDSLVDESEVQGRTAGQQVTQTTLDVADGENGKKRSS